MTEMEQKVWLSIYAACLIDEPDISPQWVRAWAAQAVRDFRSAMEELAK